MGRINPLPDPTKPSLPNWQRLLADERERLNWPEYYYKILAQMADELLRLRLVDALEHHDMIELAIAARDHAIEHRETVCRVYQRSGTYGVVQIGGDRVGRLMAAHYYPAEGIDQGALQQDASVEIAAEGLVLRSRTSPEPIARIVDQRMTGIDGREYALVPETVRIEGREVPVIEDLDEFLAAVALLEVVREAGDAERAKWLERRVRFAQWDECDCDGGDDCPCVHGVTRRGPPSSGFQ